MMLDDIKAYETYKEIKRRAIDRESLQISNPKIYNP